MLAIIKLLKKYLSYYFKNNSPICYIEDIDLDKNIVIIHCRGVDSPIKLEFNEIINDPIMLSNFSSKQASWIGYYYGKYYNGLINQKNYCNIPFGFSQNNIPYKYNIMMIARHGNLIYRDNDTDLTYTMQPINIIRNNHLIAQFDPIQACYIGILSGISPTEKILPERQPPSSTRLQLV